MILPRNPDELKKVLESLSPDDLQEIFNTHSELEKRLEKEGPKTDDELHAYIKANLGYDIPRVAVCEHHTSPFQFFADLYFERIDAALAIGSRGSGKTHLIALLHYINARHKKGSESCTFGAIEPQSQKAYSHLKELVYDENGHLKDFVVSSLMRETVFEGGSKVYILGGCLPTHAKLATPDGNVRISELVSKRLPGPVRSWDYDNQEWVWTKISDWHVNGKGTDWLKFKLDVSTINSANDLYCTEGHRLMLPDGRKRHAIEFKVGDELCVYGEKLSEEQEQIFMGKMLGDGHISPAGVMHISHTSRQLSYMEWASDAFQEFNPHWDKRKCDMWRFRLKTARAFHRGRLDWYDDKRKRIPDWVWDRLEPLGLAVWLMDDGGFVRMNRGGGGYWEIAAHHFNTDERKAASAYFDDLGIEHRWRCVNAEKDQWIFVTTAESSNFLYALVSDYIDISEKQAKGWKKWVAENISEHSKYDLLTSKITSIEKCDTEQTRYDITVPPHANYLTSAGVLVSNTPEQVNGPHPSLAHADEIELMRSDTWSESRSMTQGKWITAPGFEIDKDGNRVRRKVYIKPQDIATSTRKGPAGRVQRLVDEVDKAIREGFAPPRRVVTWCIKEVCSEIPTCQLVPEEERKSRLEELGRDPCETCNCHKIRKGEKEDGSPRTLKDVCEGDFFLSRGWQAYEDVVKQFVENDSETFDAQILCLKPSMKDFYMPSFSEEHHGIKNFSPNPANGPIFTSTDWGGTDPHAVEWFQVLKHEVDVVGFLGEPVTLRQGTIVFFSELYIAEIGNDRLGEMVLQREGNWRKTYGRFPIYERYSDPAGKGARLSWRDMGLSTTWHITREIEEHVKAIRDMMDEDLFRVDVGGCPMLIQQIKAWRRDPNTGKELDENFSHAIDAARYGIANVWRLRRKHSAISMSEGNLPKGKPLKRQTSTVTIRGRTPRRTSNEFDTWRKSLGAPVTSSTSTRDR